MAVAIRMKRMGRKNRAFYRICATDRRSPRDGRVIEVRARLDPASSRRAADLSNLQVTAVFGR